jgi:hypothetical protein
MFRPLRIEFPGASHHVTSRSDQREPIFENDSDRTALLGVLEEGMHHSDEQVLDYCLMGNQDHFVLHTRRANLPRLMRHFNGVVTHSTAATARWGICSRAVSRQFLWTGMPTCWRCPVIWNSTRRLARA